MQAVKAELKLIMAMLIFGSIGIFVKAINLPSVEIVLLRTIIGSIFLAIIFLFTGQTMNIKAIIGNLPILIIVGIFLGGNWVFLFKAYNHTTVSIATLLYYSAPIMVFLLSPIIFKEKLTSHKIIGAIITIIGMVVINGINSDGQGLSLGIIYGLLSALFYGLVMITNKFIKNLSGLESSFIQLLIAAIIMIIYTLSTSESALQIPSGYDLIWVVILGVVHTGIACYLYFSSMQELPSQTIAIMSYIDPASALIFSAIFLGERLSMIQILGALMILGGTAYNQLYEGRTQTKDVNKLKESL